VSSPDWDLDLRWGLMLKRHGQNLIASNPRHQRAHYPLLPAIKCHIACENGPPAGLRLVRVDPQVQQQVDPFIYGIDAAGPGKREDASAT
jgi:hypothetical protein